MLDPQQPKGEAQKGPKGPKGTQRHPKNPQGAPKGAQWVPKGNLRAPREGQGSPKGSPKAPKSTPRAAQRHPWAHLWTPREALGPQGIENIKKTTFLRSLLEPFLGKVHMQSVHACAVQTHIIVIFVVIFLGHVFRAIIFLNSLLGRCPRQNRKGEGGTYMSHGHGGAIMRHHGEGSTEEESLRRHLEASGRHLGRHLGDIWEASGKHLGSI